MDLLKILRQNTKQCAEKNKEKEKEKRKEKIRILKVQKSLLELQKDFKKIQRHRTKR